MAVTFAAMGSLAVLGGGWVVRAHLWGRRAALGGRSPDAALLLLAYGLGAATSLAVALLASGRLKVPLTRSLGAGLWMRRGLGATVLAAVGVSALGLEPASFAGWAPADTNRLEQALLTRIPPQDPAGDNAPALSRLPVLGTLPPLPKRATWLNSPPLDRDQLWGKVVLVYICTYSCINCVRTLPHVRAWASKYRNHGLVLIGVHSPEFPFERDLGQVIDSDFAIWKAFRNTYWPAFSFIDSQGRIRRSQVGEGAYDTSERTIQELLRESGRKDVPTGLVRP